MIFNPKQSKIPEMNITAELYHQLRLKKIPIYLQYKTDDCVFDMVVLDKQKKNIIAIVEVKSWKKRREPKVTGKQYKKYSRYGLPLIYCGRVKHIRETVSIIEVSF